MLTENQAAQFDRIKKELERQTTMDLCVVGRSTSGFLKLQRLAGTRHNAERDTWGMVVGWYIGALVRIFDRQFSASGDPRSLRSAVEFARTCTHPLFEGSQSEDDATQADFCETQTYDANCYSIAALDDDLRLIDQRHAQVKRLGETLDRCGISILNPKSHGDIIVEEGDFELPWIEVIETSSLTFFQLWHKYFALYTGNLEALSSSMLAMYTPPDIEVLAADWAATKVDTQGEDE